MAALREILIAFGIDVDTAPIDKANKKADGLIDKLEKFGKALAVFYVAKRVISEAFDLTEEAANLGRLSEQTGLNTHDLQAWQLGAKEAGVEGEGFNQALRKLSKELEGGSAKNQSKILHEYGLTALAAAGHTLTLSDALPAIAEHFKAMSDSPAKSAKATELFGRQGARLIPLLNQGAAGVEKLKADLDELGGGFSPEFIKQSVEVERQTKRLDVAWTSLKVRIFGFLLPALTAGINALISVSTWTSKLTDNTNLLGSAFAVLGSLAVASAIRIAIAYAPVIATFLAWAAAIGFAILLVDDIYGFFTGKNSLIGEAIDAAFGEGSQAKVRAWFQSVYDFGKEVFQAVKDIFGDTTKSFGDRLDAFLDYLGGAFATHFSGTFSDICQGIIAIFKVAIDALEAGISGIVKAAKWAAKELGIGDDTDDDSAAGFHGSQEEADVRPATDEEIADAFGPRAPAKKGAPKLPPITGKAIRDAFSAPQGSVSAPLPPSWDAPGTGAPGGFGDVIVNVPPGTDKTMAQRVGKAAHEGATKALKAPNRAAAAGLGRTAR